MKKTLLSVTVASLILTGCGGSGGGSDNSKPDDSFTMLKGRALLSEQTPVSSHSSALASAKSNSQDNDTGKAFYDINFDGKHQGDEPSDNIDASGNYEIELRGDNAKCEGYAPLVVEVYPVMDGEDVAVDGYTMTIAPTHAKSSEDLIAVSPLTSMVWDDIQKEVNDMPEVKTCHNLAANQDLFNEIETDIESQEWRFANTYNVTVDELYSDYKDTGNQELENLAEVMVVPMQKTYVESDKLQDQTSELSYVTYLSSYLSTDLSYNEYALNILTQTYTDVTVPKYDDNKSKPDNIKIQLKAFEDSGHDLVSPTWLKKVYTYVEQDESFVSTLNQLDESMDEVRYLSEYFQNVDGSLKNPEGLVEFSFSSNYNFNNDNYDCNYNYTSEYGDSQYIDYFNEKGYYPFVKTTANRTLGAEKDRCSGLEQDSAGYFIDKDLIESEWEIVNVNYVSGYKRFNSIDGGSMESVEFVVLNQNDMIMPEEKDLNLYSDDNKGAKSVYRVTNTYPENDPVVAQYLDSRLSDSPDNNGSYTEEWRHLQQNHDGTSFNACEKTAENEKPNSDKSTWKGC